MDPNQWNTYNFQYGAGQSGLPHTHPSLASLGLSHGLQGSHAGRSVSSIPNYSGLTMPLLESMGQLASSAAAPQQTHKAVALAEPGQLMFDSQGRHSANEQLSPSFNRYTDATGKVLRTDALSRNQLLEAARMWSSTTSFPSATSLYNQYILPETPTISSPSTGTVISKPSQSAALQEPPPAHSSNSGRQSQSSLRSQYVGDLIGSSRSFDNFIPSSSSYNNVTVSKSLTDTPHVFSSQRDNDSLTSISAQHQLYGSYSNLADPQDFHAAHLTSNAYEAVSPAPPALQETATPIQIVDNNSSFSVLQFPELAGITPEHAQALMEKFHETEYRIKSESVLRTGQQTPSMQETSLSQYQQASRQQQQTPQQEVSKRSKSNISCLPIPPAHTSHHQQSVFPQVSAPPSLLHSPSLMTSIPMSIQQQANQLPTPPTVQAPADSTTKPKRVRNRKKKDATPTPNAVNNLTNPKKSTQPVPNIPHNHHQQYQQQQQQNLQQQQQRLSHPRLSQSPQIPSLSMSSSSHLPNDNFMPAANNQYSTSHDASRAQTPSIPQNYSLTDPHQAFSHSPSPKMSVVSPNYVQAVAQQPPTNNKSTYNKQQRKPKQSSTPSVNQNTTVSQQLYGANIPGISAHQLSVSSVYSDPNTASGNIAVRTDSPNQPGSGNQHPGQVSRMGFPSMSAQHLTSQHHPSHHHTPEQHQTTQEHTAQHQTPQHHSSQHQMLHQHQAVNQQQPSDDRIHDSAQYMDPGTLLVNNRQAQSPLDVTEQHQHHQQQLQQLQQQQQVIIEGQDGTQSFQMDFSNQPFMEELVSAHNPNFGVATDSIPTTQGMIMTTLAPQEVASEEMTSFQPTYRGAAVHEIHAVGPLGGGDMALQYNDANSFQSAGNQDPASQQSSYSEFPQEPEQMTLTFIPSVEEDDEFAHFGQTEAGIPKKTETPKAGVGANASKKETFQSSFLSYLQGDKQETLSSVSSSTLTRKPQLPKYIPEPRRPKPVIPTILVKDPPTSQPKLYTRPISPVKEKEKDFLSTLSDNDNSSQKSESDKEGYIVQRTSELAMKIMLPKNKKRGKISTFDESALLSHNRKHGKDNRPKKKRGKRVDSDEEAKAAPAAPLIPTRTSIGRKAKDQVTNVKKKRRYAESGSSSEDEIFQAKAGLSTEKDYDSDKDPVWMPFDQDLKPGGHDFEEKKKKPKRVRLRNPIRAPPTPKSSLVVKPQLDPTAAKTQPQKIELATRVNHVSTKTDCAPSSAAASGEKTESTVSYRVGQFFIEKKDLTCVDSYPIWRLEESNMLHKFELTVVDGAIRHKAVTTYSAWLKSMYPMFQPIKVKNVLIKGNHDPTLVQVLDECVPTMPSDGKLMEQYEDDPLVDQFNVYLQVFISQAVEPTFLKAIMDTGDMFYLEPMNKIDELIDEKVKQLALAAKWRNGFLEAVHQCPMMKEIDRPNLKQSCQASENSSPPTIKSVLLNGQPYDRTFLTSLKTTGNEVTHEFMIGKTAAHYVRPYHSLYHFKFWLRTRCEAKVKILKESSKSDNLTHEGILDKCLENRAWVLQLFDHFKKLMAFVGDPDK